MTRFLRLLSDPIYTQAGVVDGQVLWAYLGMELRLQKELARAIGTTPETIIENIREIDRATAFF